MPATKYGAAVHERIHRWDKFWKLVQGELIITKRETWEQLAAGIGISGGTMSRRRQNPSTLTAGELSGIATYLNIPWGDLTDALPCDPVKGKGVAKQ